MHAHRCLLCVCVSMHSVCICRGVCVCLPSLRGKAALALIMFPTGAQELPCSAYYITELQRKKLVKNETNFRRGLLLPSSGSRGCTFFSLCLFISTVSLHPSLPFLHMCDCTSFHISAASFLLCEFSLLLSNF